MGDGAVEVQAQTPPSTQQAQAERGGADAEDLGGLRTGQVVQAGQDLLIAGGLIQATPASAATAPAPVGPERTVVELRELPAPPGEAEAAGATPPRPAGSRAVTAAPPAELDARVDTLVSQAEGPTVLAQDIDCEDLDSVAARSRNGLVYDHFTFCHEQRLRATWRTCPWGWPVRPPCRVTATADFTVMTEGTGIVGDRDVRFDVMLVNWRLRGAWLGKRLSVTVECEPEAGSGAVCGPGPATGRTDSLQRWLRNPLARTDWTSPEAGSVGRDKLAWYDFGTRITLPPNGRWPGDTVRIGENGFRCDSATYLAGKQGCVFDHVEEIQLPGTGARGAAGQHL